ncbi:MAG: hypothetical protein JXR56_07140 [Candidatus Cloacimonetes bacterium]|nr:hypothetical protein [Candidatus Cloacimonadota bacterium]
MNKVLVFVLLAIVSTGFTLPSPSFHQEINNKDDIDVIYTPWQLPEIYSQVYVSYLDERHIVPCKSNNQSHSSFGKIRKRNNPYRASYITPFNSPSTLKDAIIDYFSWKDPSYKLFGYYQDNSSFEVEVKGFYDMRSLEDTDYSFVGFGFDSTVNIQDKVFMDMDWWKGHFNGDTVSALNDPIVDSWYKAGDDGNDVKYIDNLKANLHYVNDFGALSLGRSSFLIGNNISGSIILDNSGDEYGYAGMDYKLGDFKYSVMQGWLVPDSLDASYADKRMVDKFIALHKLDWSYKSLNLFLGEEIVYGNRSFDPNYMIPLGFWRISEHLQADRDNVLIFGGGSLKYRNLTCYGNVIIDELTKSKLFSDWWGNKWAVQGGLSQMFDNPLLGDYSRITAEVTVVRPWLYTHKYYWNNMSHSQETLGYPLGTNLINYAVELNFPIAKIGSLDLNCNYTRQGDYANDYTWDYDYYIPQDEIEDYETKLLAGKINDTIHGSGVFTFELFNHHFLKTGVSVKSQDSEIETSIAMSYMTRF